jgi:hypothetical protein
MSIPYFAFLGDMDLLDFWTQRSLDAYWQELVKEAQEANYTGTTNPEDSDTQETA